MRFVLVAGLLIGHAVGLTQQPVFRAAVDVVSVDVAVTRGRTPVAGLAAGDFVLMDNGVRQTIDGIVTGTQPIDVTVLLPAGLLRSDQGQLKQSHVDVERLRAMLRSVDRLRVIECADDAREIAPMQAADRPVQLRSVAARVQYREFVAGSDQVGMSPLNDALFYAFAWPTEPGRRHLVIAFTSGFDSWSTTTSDRLPELAVRGDAVLHVVLLETPPDDRQGASLGRPVQRWKASFAALDDAVQRTGGALHHLQNGMDDFRQILDEFRSSYVLRYTPRGVDRAGWHGLKVTIARSETFDIRARKGYDGGK
jgi:VWFA-related protein